MLEGEWQRPVDVARLAGAVHMSTSHLQHLFKQYVRMSIRTFIFEKRLANAAQQIRATDERISSIGLAVGFPDPSNFNHAFKLRFGLSPRDYRRLCSGMPDSD
ncbi:MAG TPA: helix-turn-helix transcriptional regulator [Thermoanaerobaculia bacterium]|nr:helix-turn-helix transcriptional regulator [Thermoanaerobaculia bacterium]